MAINPIDIMSMQRMSDVSQVKQQEDTKPMTDQVNFQNQLTKEIQQASEQVVKREDAQNDTGKYDAKEKGKNEYKSDGKVKIKKKDGSTEDLKKKSSSDSFFDISV